jgi:hypothetical protein
MIKFPNKDHEYQQDVRIKKLESNVKQQKSRIDCTEEESDLFPIINYKWEVDDKWFMTAF